MDEKNPIQGQDVPPQSGSPEYFAPLQSGQYPLARPQTPQPAQPKPEVKNPDPQPTDILKASEIDQAALGQSPLATLRTFKNDVAEAVKRQKTSVISVAVAEQKRKIERHELPPTPRNPATEARRNFFMIAASVCLVIGGLGAGAYAFFMYRVPQKPVAIMLPGNPIISTNYQKEISIDSKSRGDILYLIANEKSQERPLGSVESIYFTENTGGKKQIINLERFLALTRTAIPDELARALGPDFMLGVHMIKGGKMFLILKPTYYEGAFPALLAWESTLANDVAALFNKASSTASSVFTDKIIQNKDTRIQYDDIGNQVILYSFTDKKHLIIAEDEETLAEVARRLTETAKIVK